MDLSNFEFGLILIDKATGKNYATAMSKEEFELLQISSRIFKTITTSKDLEVILKDSEVEQKLKNKGLI